MGLPRDVDPKLFLPGVIDEAAVEALPPEAAPGAHRFGLMGLHRQRRRGRRPVAVRVQVVGFDLLVVPALDDLTGYETQARHALPPDGRGSPSRRTVDCCPSTACGPLFYSTTAPPRRDDP